MANVQLLISDSPDKQNLEVEATSDNLDDHDSLANTLAVYLADNMPGLVHAARLAKSQAIIREGTQLAVAEAHDKQVMTRGAIVDESGQVLTGVDPSKLERLQ